MVGALLRCAWRTYGPPADPMAGQRSEPRALLLTAPWRTGGDLCRAGSHACMCRAAGAPSSRPDEAQIAAGRIGDIGSYWGGGTAPRRPTWPTSSSTSRSTHRSRRSSSTSTPACSAGRSRTTAAAISRTGSSTPARAPSAMSPASPGMGINGGLTQRMGPRPEVGAPVNGCNIVVGVDDVDGLMRRGLELGGDRGPAGDRLAGHRPRRLPARSRRQRLRAHLARDVRRDQRDGGRGTGLTAAPTCDRRTCRRPQSRATS